MSDDKKTLIYDCSDEIAEEFKDIAEELNEKVRAYLLEHGFFSEDTVDSWYAVEIVSHDGDDFVDIFVRAELYYEDFSEMFYEVMNPIVEAYDEDLYFELETSGISICRIWR